MQPKDRLHLENIVQHCADIDEAVVEFKIDKEAVFTSRIRRAALAIFVEQIGEESKKLSQEFKEKHPEINWRAVGGMRNFISHQYIGINPEILWDTIQNDIPAIRNVCFLALSEESTRAVA